MQNQYAYFEPWDPARILTLRFWGSHPPLPPLPPQVHHHPSLPLTVRGGGGGRGSFEARGLILLVFGAPHPRNPKALSPVKQGNPIRHTGAPQGATRGAKGKTLYTHGLRGPGAVQGTRGALPPLHLHPPLCASLISRGGCPTRQGGSLPPTPLMSGTPGIGGGRGEGRAPPKTSLFALTGQNFSGSGNPHVAWGWSGLGPMWGRLVPGRCCPLFC